MKLWSGGLVPTGIEIGLFPSTQRRLSMELQASTVGSTASSVWTSVAIPAPRPGGVMTYRYNIPMSTRRYYFRARHGAQEGLSDGAFTAKVSAKPVYLVDYMPPHPMVNAIGNVEVPGANILISSGNTPKVGSQNTTSYITKVLRVQAYQLLPSNDTIDYQLLNGYISARSATTGTKSYWSWVPIPKGVTLTKLEGRHFRSSTTSPLTATFGLRRLTNDATLTVLGTDPIHSGSTWLTQNTTFSQLVGDESYLLLVSLRSSAVATNARFQWAEITYRMPSYDKGL